MPREISVTDVFLDPDKRLNIILNKFLLPPNYCSRSKSILETWIRNSGRTIGLNRKLYKENHNTSEVQDLKNCFKFGSRANLRILKKTKKNVDK